METCPQCESPCRWLPLLCADIPSRKDAVGCASGLQAKQSQATARATEPNELI
jgi:hypothetical protein